MVGTKLNRLLQLGLLLLAAGGILRIFTRTRYSEFAGGLLIGMSLVFMIAGFLRRSSGTR